MDLTLSEDERMVRERARDLLSRELDADRRKQAEQEPGLPPVWEAIAGAGWFGAAVPAERGGAGGGLTPLALLAEELGYAGCPGPVIDQLALATAAGRAMPEGADIDLEGVLEGRQVGTFAATDAPGSRHLTRAVSATLAAISAHKILVPYAAESAFAAVAEQSALAATLHLVGLPQRGAAIASMASMSRDHHCSLRLNDVPALRWSPGSPAADPWELYLLGRDAYAVGLAARMMDMAVEHARNRVQFGRPIGTFQAVQHRSVEMAIAVYGARLLVLQGAWLLDHGRSCAAELAMAHAHTREAAGSVAAHAHQIHGALGFTADYPLQHFSRRAKAFQNTFGTAAQYKQVVARLAS